MLTRARPETPAATEIPITAGLLRWLGLAEAEFDEAEAANVTELRELTVGVVVVVVNMVEVARKLVAKPVVLMVEDGAEAVGSGHRRELRVGVPKDVFVAIMVAVITL